MNNNLELGPLSMAMLAWEKREISDAEARIRLRAAGASEVEIDSLIVPLIDIEPARRFIRSFFGGLVS